jgi:hypothetical protein
MIITDNYTQTRNAAGEKAAIIENLSHHGGQSLVYVYFNMSTPGLSWQSFKDALPNKLERRTRLHRTKSGNAVLVFRSSHPQHEYLRLASYEKTEVIVLIGGTTLWGDRLREYLVNQDLKLQELPVLDETDETHLLKFLTLMAQASGLHVAMKNDTTGTPATESTASEIHNQIDRQ